MNNKSMITDAATKQFFKNVDGSPFITEKDLCFIKYDNIVIENIGNADDGLKIKFYWKGKSLYEMIVAGTSLNLKGRDMLCIDGIEGKMQVSVSDS